MKFSNQVFTQRNEQTTSNLLTIKLSTKIKNTFRRIKNLLNGKNGSAQ
jgi:hypothetical protein